MALLCCLTHCLVTAATFPLPLIAADEEAEHELDVKYRRQLEAAKTSRGVSDNDSMDVRSAGSGDEARQGAAGEQGQGWQEECGRWRQAPYCQGRQIRSNWG